MDQFEAQQLALMQRQRRFQDQQMPNMPGSGQMVGGHFIATNPLSYLAEAVRVAGARQGEKNTAQELQALQGQRRQAITDALRSFQTEAAGAPAAPTGETFTMGANEMGDETTEQQRWKPAVAPNPYAANMALVNSGVGSLQAAGLAGLGRIPELEATKAERSENRQWRSDEAAANRQARLEEAAAARREREERAAADRQLRIDLQNNQIEARKGLQTLAGSLKPERPAQIIQTDSGPMQLVGGVAMPIQGPEGKPIGPVKTPEAQQRLNDANAALATIGQAREIIPKSTGSYIGAGIDAAGQVFGVSTKGAQAAAKLKALEGDLVSKMPKMSGPQSDKDVQLYRQMAGVIGDPTTPPATKLAALDTIEEIQKRYAGQAPMTPPAAPNAMPGPRPQNLPQAGRIRFDAQGNMIR